MSTHHVVLSFALWRLSRLPRRVDLPKSLDRFQLVPRPRIRATKCVERVSVMSGLVIALVLAILQVLQVLQTAGGWKTICPLPHGWECGWPSRLLVIAFGHCACCLWLLDSCLSFFSLSRGCFEKVLMKSWRLSPRTRLLTKEAVGEFFCVIHCEVVPCGYSSPCFVVCHESLLSPCVGVFGRCTFTSVLGGPSDDGLNDRAASYVRHGDYSINNCVDCVLLFEIHRCSSLLGFFVSKNLRYDHRLLVLRWGIASDLLLQITVGKDITCVMSI